MANVLFLRPFLWEDTEVGDWFITKDSRRNRHYKPRPVCIEYDACPKIGGTYQCTLPLSSYIGPVHEIYLHDGFVTIKVPSAVNGRTCGYVNVSRYQTAYAHRIPRAELMRWKGRGWENRFVEQPQECPGCRDEDDDDDNPAGHDTHAPHCHTCYRHRPTWLGRDKSVLHDLLGESVFFSGLQQSHINACALCKADVRQAIQVKCVLKWLMRTFHRCIGLKIAAYTGHRWR